MLLMPLLLQWGCHVCYGKQHSGCNAYLFQDKGYISKQQLMSRAGWSDHRVEGCLTSLLKDGLAMIDDGAADGVRLFWFPALSSSSSSSSQAATAMAVG